MTQLPRQQRKVIEQAYRKPCWPGAMQLTSPRVSAGRSGGGTSPSVQFYTPARGRSIRTNHPNEGINPMTAAYAG